MLNRREHIKLNDRGTIAILYYKVKVFWFNYKEVMVGAAFVDGTNAQELLKELRESAKRRRNERIAKRQLLKGIDTL